ncbi:MAG TPA: pectin acetylesterase-family hydrolase [Polyangia bacterium]|nr:pectin acetylesterase-family hydrolase [Polyangia bacterium]
MRVAIACLFVAACSHGTAAVTPAAAPPPDGPTAAAPPSEPNVADCRSGVVAKAPIEAPADTWTWIPVPEAKCRDGSSTGIGVRMHPGATQLAIYMEGGGACFHDASCAINDVLQSFDESAFNAWAGVTGSAGIFDTSRDDNPLRGWNMVYVPYCTGDVHAGAREHVDVPGDAAPKDQMFVGFTNIGYYLERLVPTFAGSSHVLVTGISAGGFGAALNYDRIAQAFCGARVTLVDDSGPPMSDAYLAPCLQQRWRALWNLDATLPADCAACRGQPDGGGIVNYVDYLAKKYPTQQLGLISANMDSVISLFFGYGENDCAGLTGPSAPMAGATFAAGLDELRSNYFSQPNLGSYIVPSTSHTWTTALTFYSTTVQSTPLPTWMNQIVNEHFATHIDP